MPSGDFTATTTPPPLTVEQFYTTSPPPPGNVGVCLSGGGSRALTAGMGQLQALSYLNLLGSVKAISTVSGGSWLGVPFEFLPAASVSDSAYLGTYQTDPGSVTVQGLSTLPAGNAGVPLDTDFFSPEFLALSAFILFHAHGVPANMLWQTLIGLNILSPYGLFQSGADVTPEDMFSYNQGTLGAITTANPGLSPETAYLFADQVASGRTPRPFLICNMGMLMDEYGSDIQLLAPVQSTAFTTGVFGAPTGTDPNGQTPGGGGVTSFAFNSNFVSANGSAVTVSQTRQWALADAVGTSSAFFAEQVANQLAEWENDFGSFLEAIKDEFEAIIHWIESHLPFEAHAKAKALVGMLAVKSAEAAPEPMEFPVLDDMIPQYYYWPVGQTSPTPNPQPTQFADGGSLENTGVCGMLAYSDIENIISCVNSEQALATGSGGVPDGHGHFLPGTCIQVDDAIPPLFGYQPYDSTSGYVPYAGATSTLYPQFANSQVFESDAFPALLQGLWNNSGASNTATSPAVFTQTKLNVLPNKWFGIAGCRTVNVVWCYLNYAQNWVDLFSAPVQALIASEVTSSSFPNYQTVQTNLTSTQINLMSMLAAWSVVTSEQASNTFSKLFSDAAKSAAGGD